MATATIPIKALPMMRHERFPGWRKQRRLFPALIASIEDCRCGSSNPLKGRRLSLHSVTLFGFPTNLSPFLIHAPYFQASLRRAACRRTVVEGAGCGLCLPHRFEFGPAGASDLSPRIRELFQKPAPRDGFRLTIYYLRGESRLGVRLLRDVREAPSENRVAGGVLSCLEHPNGLTAPARHCPGLPARR